MSKELTVEGTVESVIYNNPENGYTVFSIITDKKNAEEGADGELVCIAFMPEPGEGEFVELSGDYSVHPVYGRQFVAKSYARKSPDTAAGIERYLASGAVKGIGARLAARIVEKFGGDTLRVIEDYPEKLAGIKGITAKKAIEISEIFQEKTEERNVIVSLQGYGITVAQAGKIYERYKADALTVVKQNPYALTDEIFGIGFKIADNIAFNMGFGKDEPLRIKSGAKFVLSQETANGHCCLPRDVFIGKTRETLGAAPDVVENVLVTLQMDRSLCVEKIDGREMVYLNGFFYAESYTAKKLAELSACRVKPLGAEAAETAGAAPGIKLAERQKEAVALALSSGVLVITGGPGTGKTTIINTIIKLMEKEGLEIELCAPTGRAAKRITEATGAPAKTIHRLLGAGFGDGSGQKFEKNEDDPIQADAVIVDESSMIDLMLAFSLLKAIKPGTRLIFVGDADQLPSVGAGNVLRDIISSGVIKTVKLTEIFRQSGESAIIANAHRINRGEYPAVSGGTDFFLVKRTNADDVAKAIIELIKTRLPNYLGIDGKRDIQALSPMRRGTIGVESLNAALQAALNPAAPGKAERERGHTLFRVGDKVIQTKNNYQTEWKVLENDALKESGEGVYNGDAGIIEAIDEAAETLRVKFDDNRLVTYGFAQLDELELAYALTVHKAQGSEYHTVVLPVHSGPYMLLNRNILYTAVTRAKKCVVLVGTEEILRQMTDNNREIERYSGLSFRLEKMAALLAAEV